MYIGEKNILFVVVTAIFAVLVVLGPFFFFVLNRTRRSGGWLATLQLSPTRPIAQLAALAMIGGTYATITTSNSYISLIMAGVLWLVTMVSFYGFTRTRARGDGGTLRAQRSDGSMEYFPSAAALDTDRLLASFAALAMTSGVSALYLAFASFLINTPGACRAYCHDGRVGRPCVLCEQGSKTVRICC